MIRTNRSHLYVAAQTHPGMSGKNNEDNFAVSAYLLSPKNPTPSVLAVVSDGIGGHRAGEVAAEMAVNLISAAVEKREGGHPTAVFESCFRQVSEAVAEKAREDKRFEGMGATAACVWVIGQQLYTAYVGDSRIYLVRGQQIRQLTKDHTWVQEALEKGILDQTGLKTHPNMHVIRRYLGSVSPAEADLRMFLKPGETDRQAQANQGCNLQKGDLLVLCTDGLTDLVGESEILQIVQEKNGAATDATALAMIELANQRGGHDNITVVMLGVP